MNEWINVEEVAGHEKGRDLPYYRRTDDFQLTGKASPALLGRKQPRGQSGSGNDALNTGPA